MCIYIYMTQAFIALHTQREHPFLLAGRLRNRLAIGGNFVSCSSSKVLKVNIAFWPQFFPTFCVHTIQVCQRARGAKHPRSSNQTVRILA